MRVEVGAAEAREVLDASADTLARAARRETPAAASTISPGLRRGAAARRGRARRRPGSSRSTTGARSTSKPERPAGRARRARPPARASPARAASRKEIDDPRKSRKRSTGPPSWSTQSTRTAGKALRSPRQRARRFRRTRRFRRKRMTAQGGLRSRMRRSSSVRAGPPIPTPKRRAPAEPVIRTAPSAGPGGTRAATARRSA